MQLRLRGTQEDIIKGQPERDGLGKSFRGHRFRLFDLAEIDATDGGDFAAYTFVAHGQPF